MNVQHLGRLLAVPEPYSMSEEIRIADERTLRALELDLTGDT